jgi:hypothetical protein
MAKSVGADKNQAGIRILRIFLIERILSSAIRALFATSPDDVLGTAHGEVKPTCHPEPQRRICCWNSCETLPEAVPTKSSGLVPLGVTPSTGTIRKIRKIRKIRIPFGLSLFLFLRYPRHQRSASRYKDDGWTSARQCAVV